MVARKRVRDTGAAACLSARAVREEPRDEPPGQ
jgi:hypothetical protein